MPRATWPGPPLLPGNWEGGDPECQSLPSRDFCLTQEEPGPPQSSGRGREAWLRAPHPSQGKGRQEEGVGGQPGGGRQGQRSGGKREDSLAPRAERRFGLGFESQKRRSWLWGGRAAPTSGGKPPNSFGHVCPSSPLRCPLSKAGISQDHQCLTQWGHRPRCQHLDQAWGLCKHPSPERSPSPKSWPASGVQVHLLSSVGCLAARAQRVAGAETVGFPGHLSFLQSDRGPLGNLRCRPAGTDSPYGARGQDHLGLRVGTGP